MEVQNVLELTKEDLEKLNDIRTFMKEQQQEMIDEIETLRKLIMQSSRDMHAT